MTPPAAASVAAAALALAAALSWSGPSAAACPSPGGAPLPLVVESDGALRLESGERARLAGLDPAPGAVAALRARLAGARALVAFLDRGPNRWGERLALVAPEGAPEGVSLNLDLLSEGLARYRPDPAARPCRAAMLAAEAPARRARRGVWRARPPLDASRSDLLRSAPPGMAVVEGHVASLGESFGRIYVNMGPERDADLALTFSQRDFNVKDSLGLAAEELAGRRLRARGLIDRRFGLRMEIAGPDALELVNENADD